MQRIVFIAILLAFMSGCAAPRPQMSRTEWLAMTQRDYVGVTKDQALEAAEKLLRLADGDDFQITHTEEGLSATRNWLAYLVIAAASGTDFWAIKATPIKEGVRVSMQVNTQSQAVSPMATTGNNWTATTMPMSGSPVTGTAIYDVFWARLDYLLGKTTQWMTCETADERVSKKITWGNNEALCNGFNMKDENPQAPAVAR